MRIRETRVVFPFSSDFAAASSMMGSGPQESNETCGRAPRGRLLARPVRTRKQNRPGPQEEDRTGTAQRRRPRRSTRER